MSTTSSMTTRSHTSLLDSADDGKAAAPAVGDRKGVKSIVVVVVCVVSLIALAFMAFRTYNKHSSSAGVQSRYRTLIDSESGKIFEDFKIGMNDRVPAKNPETGRYTLYSAEACYWTKVGGAKLKPTWVLLNDYIKKPGPTKCPDCGRTVVPHNPMPPLEALQAAAKAEGK